jgi:Lysyl oxidase
MPLAVRRRLTLAGSVFILCVAGIAGAAATAGSAPTSPGLLPDLQTVVPLHLSIQNQQQHDILRFSNGIANTGDGPWALRPEHVGGVTNAIQEIRDADGNVQSEHLASTFEFHPAHNHWHIGDIAQFDVRKGSPTGPIVSDASIKVTFCLIDWYKLEGNAPNKERIFWDCANSYQGISVGWVDQYHQATEGQQLDLTNAPNANDYYLVSTANYAGKFLEKSTANNSAWVKFRLYRDSNGNRKVDVIGTSPCATPGLCGVGAPNR